MFAAERTTLIGSDQTQPHTYRPGALKAMKKTEYRVGYKQ